MLMYFNLIIIIFMAIMLLLTITIELLKKGKMYLKNNNKKKDNIQRKYQSHHVKTSINFLCRQIWTLNSWFENKKKKKNGSWANYCKIIVVINFVVSNTTWERDRWSEEDHHDFFRFNHSPPLHHDLVTVTTQVHRIFFTYVSSPHSRAQPRVSSHTFPNRTAHVWHAHSHASD